MRIIERLRFSAKAAGDYSFALGYENEASGKYGISLGYQAKATDMYAVAVGYGATAKEGTVAIGSQINGAGIYGVGIGYGSQPKSNGSIAVGTNSAAENYAVAVGNEANASGQYSVALGNSAKAEGKNSIAIGADSKATAENSVSMIGGIVSSSANNSAAIGNGAKVTVQDTVALGSGSVADRALGNSAAIYKGTNVGVAWISTKNAIAVGDGTNVTRQIIGVAAGSADTDAVNVAQLKAALATVSGGGASYTAGSGISLDNDKIAVSAGNGLTFDAANGKLQANVDGSDFQFENGTLQLKKDGAIAANDNRVVTGGTVYTVTSGLNDSKANINLGNISDDGKTVVRDLAKESVKVVAGSNVTVTEGTDGNAKTYTISVADAVGVSSGDGIAIAGTDTQTLSVKADGSDFQFASGVLQLKKDGEVAENNKGIVTGDTVYNAIINKADKATTLAGYGITDGATGTELAAVKQNLTDVTTRVSTNEANISAFSARMDTLEAAVSALSATTLEGYGITDGATKTELAAVTQNLTNVTARVSTNETNISALSGKMDTLEASVSALSETLAGYGITDGATQTELAAVTQNLTDVTARVSTNETNISALSEKVDALESSVSALSEKVDALESSINALIDTLNTPVYTEVSQQNQNWQHDGNLGFTFKRNRDDQNTFSLFDKALVDDRELTVNVDYTKAPGSLILTLKDAFLVTLSVGEHTLTILFRDGRVDSRFTVSRALDPTKFDDVAVPSDSFSFKVVWQGGSDNNISFALYRKDGTVYRHGFDKEALGSGEWRYSAWFSAPEACYVLETPMAGYQIRYENVGVYAQVTDRCCDGGAIIIHQIPRTGDTANLALWISMVVIGAMVLCGVAIISKRGKKSVTK